MIGGGREVMNCDGWFEEVKEPAGAEDNQMPTSPFCEASRLEAEPVASLNIPSGLRSPTKRDERSLELSAGETEVAAFNLDASVSPKLAVRTDLAEWPSKPEAFEMLPGLLDVRYLEYRRVMKLTRSGEVDFASGQPCFHWWTALPADLPSPQRGCIAAMAC